MNGTMLTRKNDLLKGKPVPLPTTNHKWTDQALNQALWMTG
jgi:hypothetical protein